MAINNNARLRVRTIADEPNAPPAEHTALVTILADDGLQPRAAFLTILQDYRNSGFIIVGDGKTAIPWHRVSSVKLISLAHENLAP
jgi:hypothetical protein